MWYTVIYLVDLALFRLQLSPSKLEDVWRGETLLALPQAGSWWTSSDSAIEQCQAHSNVQLPNPLSVAAPYLLDRRSFGRDRQPSYSMVWTLLRFKRPENLPLTCRIHCQWLPDLRKSLLRCCAVPLWSPPFLSSALPSPFFLSTAMKACSSTECFLYHLTLAFSTVSFSQSGWLPKSDFEVWKDWISRLGLGMISSSWLKMLW